MSDVWWGAILDHVTTKNLLARWVLDEPIPASEVPQRGRHPIPEEARRRKRSRAFSISGADRDVADTQQRQGCTPTEPASTQNEPWPDQNAPRPTPPRAKTSHDQATGPGIEPKTSHLSEVAEVKRATAGSDPWADRRASLRKVLGLAHAWAAELRTGKVEVAADIARREQISRARVSQVMALLKLVPEVQVEIMDEEKTGAIPRELVIRRLATTSADGLQVERFRRLCERERNGPPAPKAQRPERRVRRKGKEHLVEEARRLRVMLDSGEYASLAELGRAVGLSATRVRWLLDLNQPWARPIRT